VFKGGYFRNYFQSKSLDEVTPEERKRTMNYLFSIATAADPKRNILAMNVLFGTDRQKESPIISQNYLRHVCKTLIENEEASPITEATNEITSVVIKELPSSDLVLINSYRNVLSDVKEDQKKVAEILSNALSKIGGQVSSSITLQKKQTIELTSETIERDINSQLQDKSGAVFSVSGTHSYNSKSSNGTETGSYSMNKIYYVPKDKVKFFLDSLSSINDLQFDFIATVNTVENT
jgi:hypothetical protein